jgi:hypothetical protein
MYVRCSTFLPVVLSGVFCPELSSWKMRELKLKYRNRHWGKTGLGFSGGSSAVWKMKMKKSPPTSYPSSTSTQQGAKIRLHFVRTYMNEHVECIWYSFPLRHHHTKTKRSESHLVGFPYMSNFILWVLGRSFTPWISLVPCSNSNSLLLKQVEGMWRCIIYSLLICNYGN